MTSYKVLRHSKDAETEGSWTEAGEAEAVSADAAIQAVAAKLSPSASFDGDQYVAVPARSWNPATVQTETNPRVKLSR